MCRHEFLLLHGIDLRITETEALHRFYNSRGDDESCEPLVISRDHIPRRTLRRSGPDRFLKCVHVIVPVVTLLNICSREFPIFLWRVEAFQEAFFCSLRDTFGTSACLSPCSRFLCARWKREIGALQSFGGSDAYVSHDLHGLNHRDV